MERRCEDPRVLGTGTSAVLIAILPVKSDLMDEYVRSEKLSWQGSLLCGVGVANRSRVKRNQGPPLPPILQTRWRGRPARLFVLYPSYRLSQVCYKRRAGFSF